MKGVLSPVEAGLTRYVAAQDGRAAATTPMCVETVREIGDRDEWNQLVLAIGPADLRQGYEWGEVRRGTGWVPYRHAVFERGLPVAAISVTARALAGRSCSILYASRGPVMQAESELAWSGLIRAIRELAARTGAIFLRLSPGARDDDRALRDGLLHRGFKHLPDDWTVWNAPRVIMTLDIRDTESGLRKRMRESTRLCVPRAVRRGVAVVHETSSAGLRRFYRLLLETGRRKRCPVQDLAFFEALRQQYLVSGDGCLLLATYQGMDLAALLAVRFGQRAYLLYSAVNTDTEEARILRPAPALHWELMRWARSRGCDNIDWGGSGTSFPPRADDPGFGVYDFKRGFGCGLEYLTGYYDLVFRPWQYRGLRALERRGAQWAWKLRAAFNR